MTPWSLVVSRWSLANSANDQRLATSDDFYLLCPSRKRQQRDIARLLDRSRQAALVRRAHSGQASRSDLAAFRHELRQQPHVLVIDRFDLLDAELANFLAPEKLASAFAGTTRASARTRTARTAALGAIATATLRTAFAVR